MTQTHTDKHASTSQHVSECSDEYVNSLTKLQQNSCNADVHLPQELVQYDLSCMHAESQAAYPVIRAWPVHQVC